MGPPFHIRRPAGIVVLSPGSHRANGGVAGDVLTGAQEHIWLVGQTMTCCDSEGQRLVR
jgi:hypothetical protein